MPTTDCAGNIALTETFIPTDPPVHNEAEAAPPASGPSKLLKALLIGFAASVTVGLALASWYVGVRIVKTNQANSAVPPLVSKAQSPEDAMAAAYWALAPSAAPSGNLYLQVAALDPARDFAFVQSLKSQGFPAQMQTGRILIGPYSTRDEMDQARSKLRSSGVLAVDKTD
jgi:hypothetical protein